jgi:oligopeptide transport system ATP-binding protein
MGCLLDVRDLHVTYRAAEGREIHAVCGAGFSVEAGQVLGVLGESGSGKSTLAAALLGMLPPGGRIVRGAVIFEGRDLTKASAEERRGVRGRRMAMIPQEPSAGLHPTMRVFDQVMEVARAHISGGRRAWREASEAALDAVFGDGAGRIATSYPHELSGGQRQRVLIAQAIVCRPALVLADEPTASLDPSTQREILELFARLRHSYSLAVVWITHNPALLAGFADRVLVMYGGVVAEVGPVHSVLSAAQHPYTQALLGCMPAARAAKIPRLPVIVGDAPNPAMPEPGCPFEPRCAARMDVCTTRVPAAVLVAEAHQAACFKHGG